ncbi:hypothetical protein ACJMK2_043286 [Sinanodonta woodiana]|uniref:long-chain-fatty-acid--CoA ligase n=1 Tax=Sinanodonta woodiana TaxID=1069815 RepID=A0ABD3VZM2_SINWO
MTSKVAKRLDLGTIGLEGSSVVELKKKFAWIEEDLICLRQGQKAGIRIQHDVDNERYLIRMFEEDVARVPQKAFILFEDRVYTYEYVDQQANKVAHVVSQWNLQMGDTVAMMMVNEPAFVWTFLGLQKLGIAAAFINYNVRQKSLLHTVRACEAKALILGHGEQIFHAVEEIKSDLGDLPIYLHGLVKPGSGYLSWDEAMERALPVPVYIKSRPKLTMTMPCCYIFTSGTTGLPKPAIITQSRAIGISKFFQLCDFCENDIVYITTPLYHSAASGIAMMAVIDQGATMALRRKFSASHYWEDVRKYDVTVIQYIGELCRYLLAVPEHPDDGKSRVRAAIGNGLRVDIWEKFVKRFNVPKIYEYFGATEGTAAFMNLSNKIGACGRLSPFLNMLDPTPKYLVKCTDSGVPVRDKSGRCVPVKIGEPGLLIAAVPARYQTLDFYKGGKDINEKKVIRNVFEDGDVYFNFGDLLMLDKDYFTYFVDRVGDTFRWKGENVSTNEVSNVLNALDIIHDANVYGVEIPGKDGRAGMAAIHLEKNLPINEKILKEIYNHCEKNLPHYAQPVFLRFPPEMSVTVTFKQLKTEFVKDGFNPHCISDPLFYADDRKKTYSPLTKDSYSQFLAQSKL